MVVCDVCGFSSHGSVVVKVSYPAVEGEPISKMLVKEWAKDLCPSCCRRASAAVEEMFSRLERKERD